MRHNKFCWLIFSFATTLGFGPTWQSEKLTFDGHYIWNVRDFEKKDIRGEFVAKGEDQWDVAFFFTMGGRDHIYSGSLAGRIENGSLRGRVQDESKQRTWIIEGETRNGTFKGTHTEIFSNGQTLETGTLELTIMHQPK